MSPEERSAKAMSLFREGYNCCQSVAMAFCDIIEEHSETDGGQILALSSGFGGGFARLREVCGCVSGMTLVAGAVCPSSNDIDSRRKNYALVQRLAERFREENGAIVCRELLGLKGSSSPTPSARTPEFYRTRPCERLIGCAARILAEELQG